MPFPCVHSLVLLADFLSFSEVTFSFFPFLFPHLRFHSCAPLSTCLVESLHLHLALAFVWSFVLPPFPLPLLSFIPLVLPSSSYLFPIILTNRNRNRTCHFVVVDEETTMAATEVDEEVVLPLGDTPDR